MSGFHLEIVTPDGTAYDGEAQRVIIRTTEGDVGILKNHADYLAPIAIGEARILFESGERHASCGGGMITVAKSEVRIVATTFEWADEIDVARAQKAKEEAERRLSGKLDDYELKTAEYKLKRALNRIKVGTE